MQDDGDNTGRLRLVVVGNGMTSVSLLEGLEAGDALHRFDVTVIGDEPRPAYDRVHITSLFSGKAPDALTLYPASWYAARRVRLLTGQKASEIDRVNRCVRLERGDSLDYDFCVLATGSRPFVPPIPGTDVPGVFLYRTIEDLLQIKEYAVGKRTAAVMGGGLLGLEAAKALYDLGLATHVFEMAPNLMPRQLDADCARTLLQEIEQMGVRVHLLRAASGVQRRDDGLEVQFSNAEPLCAEVLVISAGVRPRDELARSAGLTCGTRGGVAVNDALQTSDPRVYAIGECAAWNDKVYGLVGPCYEMAETLAGNLCSLAHGTQLARSFSGASEAARLKLMGVDVTTLGSPIGAQEDCVLLSRNEHGARRTLMLRERQIVGAMGVGEWPERERVADAIARGTRLSRRQLSRFERDARLWRASQPAHVVDWPAAATVCSCLRVSRGRLGEAMANGCNDVDALARQTGASTVCGSCRPLLASLVSDPDPSSHAPAWRVLLVASALACALLLAWLVAEPIPFASSVQSRWHDIDALWRESWAKQTTGYVLLGLSLAALSLSLRKRWTWLSLGRFSTWRNAHSLLGVSTLVGFLLHTGLHLGANLTLALAAAFLAINFIGAATGIAAALESRMKGGSYAPAKRWRPRLAMLHIWMFWPFPVLVVFHVISVYYY
ncbi:MAG: NAD(P)/FAD-dependent oxidoreductase [Planctomycetales bacterium]|nr:NAD(P)/FAD-dependent oxidoreductase [Planctomycetales bacterium]